MKLARLPPTSAMTISITESLLRLGAGLVLGALVGLERESTGREAGLRTHLLVALASTLVMLVSCQFFYLQNYPDSQTIMFDPSKIASNVMTGVGFLGAGAILRSGLHVRGLTTAASVWLVAGVGLACGAGMYVEGASATGAGLFCLCVLRFIEVRCERKRPPRWRVTLELLGSETTPAEVLSKLEQAGVAANEVSYSRDVAAQRTRLVFDVGIKDAEARAALLAALEALPGASSVSTERPSR
jgi:putative Mg2+ transporter-C (MgtC) family protein